VAGLLTSAALGGLLAGSVFALVGLGVLLSATAIRTVNLAVGEFYVLGGLMFFSLVAAAGVPPLLAAPLAVAAGAGCGLLVERCAIRPVRLQPPGTIVLVTTAAAWMLRGTAQLAWGRDPVAPPALAGGQWAQAALVIGWAIAATVALEAWLSRSHPGRALRATADDPRAAAGAGVDTTGAARLAFALTGALLASSAVIAGPVTFLSYDGGVGLLLRGIGAALIGGMRRPLLVYLGGVAIGLVESMSAALWSSLYKDAVTFCLLLVVLCFWRGGDEP